MEPEPHPQSVYEVQNVVSTRAGRDQYDSNLEDCGLRAEGNKITGDGDVSLLGF